MMADPQPAPTDILTPRPTGRSIRKSIHKLFVRVWLPLAVLFTAYLFYSYRATGFDRHVLSSDADVTVLFTADSITFAPTRNAQSSSLIFLPGAMVDPDAYAPLAHSVAEHGYRVVIPKLPLRWAPFDSQREAVVLKVKGIIESADPATRWVIAGHSLGGVLACRVAHNHATLAAGLVLIGTSHPRDFDLSHLRWDVTKVSATNDGLATPAAVAGNANKLPAATHWIRIEGGNHSQFGYYGFQLGDHRATIPRSDQQAQTLQALLDSLRRVSEAAGALENHGSRSC
jgi:pimeloyl-ACP methyl ester carboxylesterase